MLAVSGSVFAASVPNTFTAGAPAKASEVNANFAALVAAVTTLENKVATLEGANGPLTNADIVGTYRLLGIGTSNGSKAADRRFKSRSSGIEGTVTFNANGTYSASISERANEFSGKAQDCHSVAANTSDTSVSSFGPHHHQYTEAGCNQNADVFSSTATPEPPTPGTDGGTWVLNASARTITVTPSGEAPTTIQLSRRGDVGFLAEADADNDPSNPGRSFTLEVLVKQ